MIKGILACSSAVAIGLVLGTGSMAHAEEESAAPSGLQDIIVTAQKRSESVNTVPLSISVASGEALARAGVQSTEDLQKVVPGFSYTESAYSTPVFTLRGIGFYETSLGAKPTVSVYVDEAPLPFSVMARGATLDLERVEVLKGPQGALFGENSTGGAINYIAAKPTDAVKAGLDVGYASYDAISVGGFVSGPITDTLKARLAVKTEQGGGFQRSYTRDDHLGDKDFITGRLLLDFEPTERLRFSLNLNGFIDQSDGVAAQMIAAEIKGAVFGGSPDKILAYPLAPKDNRSADWTPARRPARDNRMWQAVFRGDFDATENITLTSLTSYAKYTHDTVIDPDGMDLQDYTYTTLGTIKAFSQELRVAATFNNIDLIIGGNYSDEKAFQRDNSGPYADTPAAYIFYGQGLADRPFFYYSQFSDQKFRTKAVFGNIDWTVGNFVLHGGVRYTDSSDRFAGCTQDTGFALGQGMGNLLNLIRAGAGLPALPPIPEGGCVTIDGPSLTYGEVQNKLSENNVSWRAGVDWKPRPEMMFYATVSRGYKQGSFPLLSASDARQLDPVTQESVTAYEVGIKASLLDHKAQINAAAFYYDYKDKQLKGMTLANPDIFGPLQTLVNIPKSKIKGAELQVNLLPTDGLNIMLAGTFTDTSVSSHFVNNDPRGNPVDFKGDSFPYTPKWNLIGNVSYEFPLTNTLRGNLGANVSYRSATNAGFGNLTLFRIDGYTLASFQAGVKTEDDRWSLDLFIRNAFNKYYWNNTADIRDTIVRYTGTPRTIGATLAFRY